MYGEKVSDTREDDEDQDGDPIKAKEESHAGHRGSNTDGTLTKKDDSTNGTLTKKDDSSGGDSRKRNRKL